MKNKSNIQPTGKPLDLEDKEHCSVVLTTDVLKIKIEGKFRQRERKLFVLLVHSVWEELGKSRKYKVSIDKIKRVFREVASVREFNTWLWDYLKNLAEVQITYEDERFIGITRLFSEVKFDKEKENVIFEIPQSIEEAILAPNSFARLDTYFLVGLRGKYSVSLYQLLESKINLRKFNPEITPNQEDRYITIEVNELRGWLGLGNQYKRWIDFKRFALLPAIEEINSNPIASTFSIETEEVTGSRNKVKAIKFFLTKTPERIKLEKSLQTTKKAKEIANESFLIPPFKGTEVYERAKKYANRLDVYKLEAEWRKFAKEKNQPIKNPELAFIGFVKKRCSA